ncbi:MAG: DUF3467 domain-containing protein [Dehalococcoidales bacterium]|nr:DUF3467 domain-containing protein [Dehalococcoidales bacterium]
MDEKANKQQIKIAFPEALRGGVYANNMFVTHTREEFILDFMMVTPPAGSVTARVVISPGHMKRMVSALKDNLNKYEAKFGKLTEAVEPDKPPMGFHPSLE